jgi:hypothetical protein
MPSSRKSPRGWEWDYRSADRSSNHMAVNFGRSPTALMVQHSSLNCGVAIQPAKAVLQTSTQRPTELRFGHPSARRSYDPRPFGSSADASAGADDPRSCVRHGWPPVVRVGPMKRNPRAADRAAGDAGQRGLCCPESASVAKNAAPVSGPRQTLSRRYSRPDVGRQRERRSGQTRDLPGSDTIPLHVMWP